MSRTRTSSRRTVVSAGAGGLGLTLIATAALMGPASATSNPKVTVCHATASAQNPYVAITVATSSIAEGNNVKPNGHGTHTGPVFDPQGGRHQQAWGDIIPAFSGANSFAGLNLSDAGRAILSNGCAVVAPSPTPTESESEHSTPTPTESESEHSTPTPTPTETTPAPTPTDTTPAPTPTDTTPAPTPTETTPAPTPTESTPDPTPTGPTQDPGTPTDVPTSTPDPTPSSSTSETPESLPSTGGRTTGLPQTGSSAALVALLGAGLLGLGGVTILAGRRRPVADSMDVDDAS